MRVSPALLREGDPLPAAESATEEGLVAIGGALSVGRLREAYSKGSFPWSANPVTWWSPDPRAILPLDGLRVSRRLAQKVRQQRYRVSADEAFVAVMRACAKQPRRGERTWITKPFLEAYERFHAVGAAHSLEIWGEDGALIGGVYGVTTGACFSGESMFHARPDGSKLALYHLVERLRERGFLLFDAQVLNPFTEQMGAVEIPRSEYLELLQSARRRPTRASDCPSVRGSVGQGPGRAAGAKKPTGSMETILGLPPSKSTLARTVWRRISTGPGSRSEVICRIQSSSSSTPSGRVSAGPAWTEEATLLCANNAVTPRRSSASSGVVCLSK